MSVLEVTHPGTPTPSPWNVRFIEFSTEVLGEVIIYKTYEVEEALTVDKVNILDWLQNQQNIPLALIHQQKIPAGQAGTVASEPGA